MASSVTYNADTRCFFLRLTTSFYALRVLPDGEVVHVGSGPLMPGADASPQFDGLDQYEESNFVWDDQVRRWELPTFGDVTYHDVAVKTSLLEDGNAPLRDLRLRYVGYEIRTDARPGLSAPAGSATVTTPRETLCIQLRDISYDFEATLYYRVTPDDDVIERWLNLKNGTTAEVLIESLAFGTVHVPNGRYELTRVAGTWAREFIPVRQDLEQGRTILESQGLNTGHATNPFYLLNEQGRATEDAGTVYFGALAYSGNWNLRFETFPTGAVRVHGGYDPFDFSLTLKPGETHTTPAFVHGCSPDGRGGASRRLHRFTKNRILPKARHGAFRPVLYNSWEAVYFDMTSESQMELARKAADIGVELFCVDDGWFGGRRNDHAGLGDWQVSPDVFPSGLTPLIDEVKRLGMRFGLWVEPEMVNPDSDLYRAHPEWVLHFEGRPRTEMRNQLILDFGRPEVVEHIWSVLDRLMQGHDITFFKWDMNRYATEPGSAAGQAIWWRHVAGLYGIMDRLRAAYPGLEIQSCSGGGGRIDLGVLARTDQAWTSDNTDAFDRVQIQEGFSFAYPPRAMEAWVTHDVNHQTGRAASLDLRFDVAMRGALGIGTSLNELSDEELARYARKIAFYKRIRPIVHDGDLYRLAYGQDGSTWLTATPDGSRAVYSVIVTGQFQGVFRAPSRLPGLTPNARYTVTDEAGATLGTWTGFQLGTLGLPGDPAAHGNGRAIRSSTLLIEQVP